MRARLNRLVLAGHKTATAGLLTAEYEAEDEVIEQVGEQLVLVDDEARPLARVEVTAVEVMPFCDVTWDFADAEGEGFVSIEDWRAGHRRFWAATGAAVSDSTMVVCIRFRLV